MAIVTVVAVAIVAGFALLLLDTVSTMRGWVGAIGIAMRFNAVVITIHRKAIVTCLIPILNTVATIRREVRAGGIAGLTNAVGIVVVFAGITKFTIGDFVVPTIGRIPITGSIAALTRAISVGVGCAIVAEFPGLAGAIAAAGTRLVSRAADIVEYRGADALVGGASLGAVRTRQAFPVGGTV